MGAVDNKKKLQTETSIYSTRLRDNAGKSKCASYQNYKLRGGKVIIRKGCLRACTICFYSTLF